MSFSSTICPAVKGLSIYEFLTSMVFSTMDWLKVNEETTK
jgi:hypothetical protein